MLDSIGVSRINNHDPFRSERPRNFANQGFAFAKEIASLEAMREAGIREELMHALAGYEYQIQIYPNKATRDRACTESAGRIVIQEAIQADQILDDIPSLRCYGIGVKLGSEDFFATASAVINPIIQCFCIEAGRGSTFTNVGIGQVQYNLNFDARTKAMGISADPGFSDATMDETEETQRWVFAQFDLALVALGIRKMRTDDWPVLSTPKAGTDWALRIGGADRP